MSLPPPPMQSPITSYRWKEWLRKLTNQIGGVQAGTFNALDFTSSNITSILTRNHNNLQNIDGGASNDYYHLTGDQHAGLVTISTKTNSDSPYTVLAADGTLLCDCASGAITINLPSVGAVDSGKRYTIKKIDATGNAVTINDSGTDLIDGAGSQSLSSQWQFIQIQSNGTSWYIVGET